MSDIDHAKLRELFDRAMQLATSERQSFLDRECRGDATLHARVLELVKAAEAEGTFLSSPTGDMGTQALRQLAATVPLVEGPGTKIGLYKLLQLIGEGGFGSVFLAEQEKPVRRRVALKIIKLGMDTRSIIARFEAERQALALMDHPHIARVLDAGSTESGRPFFVMEYVVGDAITRFADAHKLGVNDRLELFAQVCQAVQHAHTKGIIHRDLKPGNILVSMSDGKPFAKVIDFGIAKATAHPLTDKTLFTEHRQLIGTPEYMSPEQAEGSPDIDTRTDVYALGVLLYELLTGATPFEAKRLRSAAYAEMQRIIREEEPPMPSVRLQRDLTTLAETASARRLEPAALNSQVKGELDWIVMKALDKERARRYESASQLAADVQRHLAGEAVVAAPASAAYRVRKFVRRNKGAVISAEVVLAALLVGTASTTWQMLRADAAVKKLTSQRNQAEAGVGKMMSILTDGATAGPIVSTDEHGNRQGQQDPLAYAIGFGTDLAESLRDERKRLQEQTDAAEWSAYTANIALAQASMQSNNWPKARQRLEACPPSKRGWEWHLLNRKSEETRWAKLGDFKAAVMSRDGKYVATLSNYARPQVWDAQTGARLFSLKLDDSVNCIAFSPDASRLVTATIYGGVDSWDCTGKHLHTFSGHSDQVNSIAFTDDGGVLVTASIDHTARVWNAADGKAIQTLRPNDQPVTSACVTPDGARIATTSSDGTLRIWDRRSGDALKTIPTGDSSVWSATFAPDGKVVATVSQRGDVSIWNCESGAKIMHAEGACSQSCQPYFAADGKALITGSFDHSIVVRDPSTLRALDSVALPKVGPLRSISGDAKGSVVASVSSGPIDSSVSDTLEISVLGQFDGAISERARESGDWDASLSAEALLRSIELSPIEGRSIVTPKGDRKLSIESDRTIRLSEPASGKEVATFSLPDAAIKLRMRGDGAILIISLADEDSPELFWDIRDSAERMKDRQREWDEQSAADSYVDALLAGSGATGGLDAMLRADESLTPIRRLAAWRTLRNRLADIERDASERFDAITKAAIEKSQTDKPAILAIAAAAEAPPRVKQILLAKAEKWVFVPPRVDETEEKLKQETNRRRLAEADLVEANYGRYDLETAPSAIPALTQAVRTREELLGPAHVKTLDAMMLLSWYSFYEPETTYAILRDAVARRDLSSDAITSRTLELWDRYANACVNTLRFDEAADWYRRIGKELCQAVDYAKANEVSFPAFRSRADRPGENRGFADLSDCKELASDLQKVDAPAVKLQFAPMEKQQLDQYLLINDHVDQRERQLIARRTAILAAAAPEDSSALRTVAFGRLRIDDAEGAFAAMAHAIALQASKREAATKDADVDPVDLAILAVARFGIAEKHAVAPGEAGQLNGRPMTSEENKDAAIKEFARARSLFDRTAAKSDDQPAWSKGERAAWFFKEAEKLIQRGGEFK